MSGRRKYRQHCLTLEGRLVDRSFYKDIALLASMANFVKEVMISELTSKSFTISLLLAIVSSVLACNQVYHRVPREEKL